MFDVSQGLYLFNGSFPLVPVVRPGDALPDGMLVTVSDSVNGHHLNHPGEISFPRRRFAWQLERVSKDQFSDLAKQQLAFHLNQQINSISSSAQEIEEARRILDETQRIPRERKARATKNSKDPPAIKGAIRSAKRHWKSLQ